LDQQVQLVKLEYWDNRVLRVLWVPLVHKAQLVIQDYKELPEVRAQVDCKGPLGERDLLEQLVHPVVLEQLDRPDSLDHQDSKEQLDHKDLLVNRVLLAQRASQVILVHKVLLVLRVKRDLRVLKVELDRLEMLAQLA